MRMIRWYRWQKRILLLVALLPLCQTTCTIESVVGSLAQQLGYSVFNLFVSGANQTLLLNFPGADLLQIALGGNQTPFFGF